MQYRPAFEPPVTPSCLGVELSALGLSRDAHAQTDANRLCRDRNHDGYYDCAWVLTNVALPDGASLTYTYAAAYRLTAIADHQDSRVGYTLDAMGNCITEGATDNGGTLVKYIQRAVDALNRVQQVVDRELTQSELLETSNIGDVPMQATFAALAAVLPVSCKRSDIPFAQAQRIPARLVWYMDERPYGAAAYLLRSADAGCEESSISTSWRSRYYHT